MEGRVFNFSAGPAGLPLPVLEKAQAELLCYPGAGASVMEISHRSKAFDEVHAGAKAGIAKLLGLGDDYHVLFIQGGASLQFSMLAMNFLNGKTADYIDTGAWSSKAVSEAKKHGTPRVVWTGKADNYVRVPQDAEFTIGDDAEFVHYCANETIQGVEFFHVPDAKGKPLFCDYSSTFLSRPIDAKQYGLIYAGAQKNIGPSGVAVAILRKDLLERVPAGLPSLLDYKILADNDSLYNTPPCFGIYIIKLVTEWLLNDIGGLDKMEALNRSKAAALYDAIDASGGFFKGHAQKDCRSLMNVTFTLPSEALEKDFIKQATANGMVELKGHRSVGGCRASIYNAMPLAGCQALASFMKDFAAKNG